MKKGKRNKQIINWKKKEKKSNSSVFCQIEKENVSRPCRCMVKAIFRSRKSFKSVCVYVYINMCLFRGENKEK